MLADLIALVILVALILYTITGGADFGGGVWDLFARGPRKQAQRDLIARAIAPIWEANHVWLILIVVVLFVAQPRAFTALGVALHIPVTLMLIGIVLRGAAFVFRTYDPVDGPGRRRWRLTFAIASVITPIFLGVTLAAVATGALRMDVGTGHAAVDALEAWLSPFPFLVGAFTLALFAFLAAVYLTVEAEGDAPLQDDFRARALTAAALVGLLALATFIASYSAAPRLAAGLGARWWSWPLHAATALAAIAAVRFLLARRYRLARIAAAGQATLIVVGLAAAQYPYVIAPDLTFEAALAPPEVVVPMLVILAVGAPFLGWAMLLLYRVFRPGAARPPGPTDDA